MNHSASRPVVANLTQTCEFAPGQWDGRTVDGRPISIRGRNRVLSARIGPVGGSISDAVRGEELVRIEHEEADVLFSEDILCLLADILDYSQVKCIESEESLRDVDFRKMRHDIVVGLDQLDRGEAIAGEQVFEEIRLKSEQRCRGKMP